MQCEGGLTSSRRFSDLRHIQCILEGTHGLIILAWTRNLCSPRANVYSKGEEHRRNFPKDYAFRRDVLDRRSHMSSTRLII
jgi:hypothetical protein